MSSESGVANNRIDQCRTSVWVLVDPYSVPDLPMTTMHLELGTIADRESYTGDPIQQQIVKTATNGDGNCQNSNQYVMPDGVTPVPGGWQQQAAVIMKAWSNTNAGNPLGSMLVHEGAGDLPISGCKTTPH